MVDFSKTPLTLTITPNDKFSGGSGMSNAPTPNPQQSAATTIGIAPPNGQNPQKIIAAATTSASSINQLEYPTYRPKYYLQMQIGTYSRSSLLQVSAENITDSIILPLPEKIADGHGVAYAESPLGALLGGTINTLLQTTKSAAATLNSASDTAIAGGLQVADRLGNRFGLGSAAAAFSAFTGFAPNQFLTIQLQGPQYKKYQFNWTLSPRNSQESTKLNKILNLLHNSAAPGLATSGQFFSFPKIFQLAFYPNSQYLVKFKPAALTDIFVDYTGAGSPSFYRSGNDNLSAPTHVNIQLHFLELEFWLSGNWQNNNDPLDVHQQTATAGPTQALLDKFNHLIHGGDNTPFPDPNDPNGFNNAGQPQP